MKQIIRAILRSNDESVKKLLDTNLSCFMSDNPVIINCDEEFIGNYSDEYIRNFESQKKQFLQLLDNDEHKTISEQRKIGLDFLLFTCKYLYKDIFNYLIRYRMYNPSEDKWDFIQILKDFEAGKQEIYNFLLNGGIGAVQINGLQLLHRYLKSATAREDVVKKFLQLGADVNCLDHLGRSVLNCAVLYGLSRRTIEIVKLLLEHGANTNLGSDCTLATVAALGNRELVELLLEHGANINGLPDNLITPLASAASFGRVEIVELLLERGAERDNHALLEAVRNNTSVRIDNNDRRKMVKLLLDQGFDVNYATSRDTVLSKAIRSGQEDIAKLLLEHGAQVDKAARLGWYPLHCAAEGRNVEMIRLLLKHGADSTVELTLTKIRRMNYFADDKFLVRVMTLLKAHNVYVSKGDLNGARMGKKLAKYQVNCEEELKNLKLDKFDDSTLSSFDFLTINDSHRLASLASNDNIAKVIGSEDFKEKFPIYGDEIVKKFERGIAKKKDFDLIKRFVNYLSTRNHDQLPKLPFTIVTELFNYLNRQDFVTLRKL